MSSPSTPSRTVFVDRMGPAALLRLLGLRRSLRAIWYFDAASPVLLRLISWSQRLGLLRAEVRQVEHNIGHVRDDSGKFEWDRLWGYIREVGMKIKKERTLTDPLVRRMAPTWELAKVATYFEKKIEYELRDDCYRIGLVEWMARSQLGVEPSNCILVLERRQWYPYIRDLARSRGMATASYLDPRGGLAKAIPVAFKAFDRGLLLLKGLASSVLRRARFTGTPRPESMAATAVARGPAIGIRYYFRSLSLDPSVRSEFFWLQGSDIPYSDVLLYDYVTDVPLDAETTARLREQGIRLLGRGPGVPTWRPTPRMYPVLFRVMSRLARGLFASWARGQWVSPYYLRQLVVLGLDYSYWYDFYEANGVRVNVSAMHNLKVSQVLALDALNGVSAVYQYASSIICLAASYLYAGEDVVFVFSPAFEKLWHKIRAPVRSIVPVGFIDDGAVSHLRTLRRPEELRGDLESHGARFVLSYFDENSTDRWNNCCSDEQSADDYEFLLRWLLADPYLGIVFKPKKATNLLQRIQRVKGLVDEAMATGRCKFLMGETVIGGIFPAEAALAADICIGRPGTAALESRLAGVPSLMVDLDGFRDAIYQSWGRGTVVFDDWPSLRAAVERYRDDPEGYSELGDWSPGIDEIDPFRDGNASRRIGLYVKLIYDSLNRGASREEALAKAAEQYAGQARDLVRTG